MRLHWKYLIESPAQVRPPFRGAGLEHVRLLLMVPAVPQLLEQEDKVPQEPQLPFTAAIENSEFQNKTEKKNIKTSKVLRALFLKKLTAPSAASLAVTIHVSIIPAAFTIPPPTSTVDTSVIACCNKVILI